MSLKIIGSVVGVTGIVGGATYVAFKHPNLLNVFSLNSSSSEKGKCMPIEATAENILQGIEIEKDKYISISCKNTDSVTSAKKFADEWMGWFPKSLLKVNDGESELSDGFDFETAIQLLKDRTNEYQITFKGDKFLNSPVSGIWTVEEGVEEESAEKPITITASGENSSQEKIYLLFIENQGQEAQ